MDARQERSGMTKRFVIGSIKENNSARSLALCFFLIGGVFVIGRCAFCCAQRIYQMTDTSRLSYRPYGEGEGFMEMEDDDMLVKAKEIARRFGMDTVHRMGREGRSLRFSLKRTVKWIKICLRRERRRKMNTKKQYMREDMRAMQRFAVGVTMGLGLVVVMTIGAWMWFPVREALICTAVSGSGMVGMVAATREIWKC
jgi:hypothetical protein